MGSTKGRLWISRASASNEQKAARPTTHSLDDDYGSGKPITTRLHQVGSDNVEYRKANEICREPAVNSWTPQIVVDWFCRAPPKEEEKPIRSVEPSYCQHQQEYQSAERLTREVIPPSSHDGGATSAPPDNRRCHGLFG